MKQFFMYFLPWLGNRMFGNTFNVIRDIWQYYFGYFKLNPWIGLFANGVVGLCLLLVDLVILIIYEQSRAVKFTKIESSQLLHTHLLYLFGIMLVSTIILIIVGQYSAFKDEQQSLVRTLGKE